MANLASGAEVDVLVLGGGIAGLCAALSAHESGARVRIIDRGPRQHSGGNTRFAGGGFRVPYNSVDDIRRLIPDLSESEAETHFGAPYPESEFFDDMASISQYHADPDLVEAIVTKSYDTMIWLRSMGVRFTPWPGWHGMALEVSGGGAGLVESLSSSATKRGIPISYESRAVDLLRDNGRVVGAVIERAGAAAGVRARSVVLATGGFQSSAEWRARYLGPGWDLVPVRGTWTNTGDGLRMAMDVGAQSVGHWSKAHSAAWDLNAPSFGDPSIGDLFKKHCGDLGIMVNANGERFMDEGAGLLALNYARSGPEILKQPNAFAWQVFDSQVTPLLGGEYHIKRITRVRADSLEELANKLVDVEGHRFLQTVEAYNAAVDETRAFDHRVLDGRGTVGLALPKSNWALTISEPPFEAYAVTCGITFTYGGIKIDQDTRVLGGDGTAIPGLFACGEMVGGIFYYNYAAGASLTSGSVFGRAAGTSAAPERIT